MSRNECPRCRSLKVILGGTPQDRFFPRQRAPVSCFEVVCCDCGMIWCQTGTPPEAEPEVDGE